MFNTTTSTFMAVLKRRRGLPFKAGQIDGTERATLCITGSQPGIGPKASGKALRGII